MSRELSRKRHCGVRWIGNLLIRKKLESRFSSCSGRMAAAQDEETLEPREAMRCHHCKGARREGRTSSSCNCGDEIPVRSDTGSSGAGALPELSCTSLASLCPIKGVVGPFCRQSMTYLNWSRNFSMRSRSTWSGRTKSAWRLLTATGERTSVTTW